MQNYIFWKNWFYSCRPKTLIVCWGPFLISLAFVISAYGSDKYFSFIDGIIISLVWGASLILQIACNFTNDYYDFLKGSDDDDRLGPKRMLQQNIITLSQMKKALFITYGSFFFITLFLSFIISWIILPMAILSMLVAFSYTGGKFPLAYHRLGDITAFLFFGPFLIIILLFTTGYRLLDFSNFYFFPWQESFLLGLSPGFFALTLLNINNLRDFGQDKIKNKKTLAILLGEVWTRRLIAIYFFLSLFSPMIFIIINKKYIIWVLLLFIFPWLWFVKNLYRFQGKEMNLLLGNSSGIYFWYTILFFIVWLW
jgi:1,4-dihydroxy-2-naphthoate octaprenyltransferase